MYFVLFSSLLVPISTALYTLSLHDALPISARAPPWRDSSTWTSSCRGRGPAGGPAISCPSPCRVRPACPASPACRRQRSEEHTSNSSHVSISYAVFCLKKQKAHARAADR